jgi:hypothetical protein
MTGQQLYAEYYERMEAINIPVETWSELKESEQVVWEQLAVILR